MLAELAIAAALLIPTGNYGGPLGGENVVCDSSTVPVQSGGVVVCVAPSAILGNYGAYAPVQGFGYPVSLGGWYNSFQTGGFGYPGGYFGGGFGGPFRGGFGRGWHDHDRVCTTTGTPPVRTCTG